MTGNRFAAMVRAMTSLPTRRDVPRAFAGAGLGWGAARLPEFARAKKRRNTSPRKPKPNGHARQEALVPVGDVRGFGTAQARMEHEEELVNHRIANIVTRSAADGLRDPARDAVRSRACRVHPAWTRHIGSRRMARGATLPGEPLYAAMGNSVTDRFDLPLPDGAVLPAAHMAKSFASGD